MLSIFDLVNPGLFFAFDCTWLHHAMVSFLGTLIMPIILIAVLVGIMGGDSKNIGEAVMDAVSTALVVLIDLSVCLLKYSFLVFGFILSALFRTIAEYQAAAREREKVNLKTGDGPEYGPKKEGKE